MKQLLRLERARADHVGIPSVALPESCGTVVTDAQEKLLNEVLGSQLHDRDNVARLDKMRMVVDVFGPVLSVSDRDSDGSGGFDFKGTEMYDRAREHMLSMFDSQVQVANLALDNAVTAAKEIVASRLLAIDGIGFEEDDVNLSEFAHALLQVHHAVELHGVGGCLGSEGSAAYNALKERFVTACAAQLNNAKELFGAMRKHRDTAPTELPQKMARGNSDAGAKRRSSPPRPDQVTTDIGKRADGFPPTAGDTEERPPVPPRSGKPSVAPSKDGIKRPAAPPVPSAPPAVPPPYTPSEYVSPGAIQPRQGAGGESAMPARTISDLTGDDSDVDVDGASAAPKAPRSVDIARHEGTIKLASKSVTALNVVTDLVGAAMAQGELSTLGITDAVRPMVAEADLMYVCPTTSCKRRRGCTLGLLLCLLASLVCMQYHRCQQERRICFVSCVALSSLLTAPLYMHAMFTLAIVLPNTHEPRYTGHFELFHAEIQSLLSSGGDAANVKAAFQLVDK
jgi:hypothetical protein